MDGYIQELRQKYDHLNSKKPQLSPHAHRPIDYGPNKQIDNPEDTNNTLVTKGINKVQGIVGSLQYVSRAVTNKLLVALRNIGTQQATATANTNTEITQLLEYVATLPRRRHTLKGKRHGTGDTCRCRITERNQGEE